MSRFTDELFDVVATTDKGLVTGEPRNPLRRRWREVHAVARSMAGALARAGVGHGDSVAILAGQPANIAPLIQAIWLQGASFTMLHQPTATDLDIWMDDTLGVLSMLGASVVVVGYPFDVAASALTDRGFRVLGFADLSGEPQRKSVQVSDDDTAILQLTSGSTAAPKAVAISHANLYWNHHAMRAGSGADGDIDVAVSWLPLSHDMGMVGFLIEPMICGMETVCVTPAEFLTSPLVWAELITKYRGTMTAAPNFAYAVLARRLRTALDGAYDLSSLRFVLNGAEPIDIDSVELLLAEGARFGLRRKAIVAAYGMAEATLAVSFGALDQPISVETVDADLLEVDQVAIPSDGARTRSMVRLGRALPGLRVRAVDASRTSLEPRHIGEIEISGRAVTTRYLTPTGFRPAVDQHGWLASGDMGYLTDDGEITLTGRKKEIVIIAGRNIAPVEIENAAYRVAGVRPGTAAAVRITGNGRREDFAVIVESTHADNPTDAARLRSEVSRAVLDRVGAAPGSVMVVARGSLPKTPSGKIRRSAAGDLVTRLSRRAGS